jgi:hypothetical protein
MDLKHILGYGDRVVKKKTNLEKQAEKQIVEDVLPDDAPENEITENKTKESKEIVLTESERKEILQETFADINEDDTPSDAENLAEIIKAWLDDKYIHAKTRLNQNQIIALTILKTLAEKYQVNCIKQLIDNFVRYKLSEGGQSSKELVEILKSRTDVEMDDSLAKAVEPFMK